MLQWITQCQRKLYLIIMSALLSKIINSSGNVFYNLSWQELYTHATENKEGCLTNKGVLRVLTGEYTGRSPQDRYIVKEKGFTNDVDWNHINKPISREKFEILLEETLNDMANKKIYIKDGFIGANKRYRLETRVISNAAYHALFVENMFLRPSRAELEQFKASWHIVANPYYHSSMHMRGKENDVYAIICFSKKIILIGGTLYSGEIKKGIFSVMNYILPQYNVLPMHCSANETKDGQVSLFFGLSGTGKTTLSSNPKAWLIGDDEHGWGDEGVFNFEGGCYAKTIDITYKSEPLIYEMTEHPGSILENIGLNHNNEPQYKDKTYTENTRCAYPTTMIYNAKLSGLTGHPKHIIFLTLDAFGVLPPISRLTIKQAMYHFISGYTAKVAGTERGISEPEITFSACFGAPFMPRKAWDYAQLLEEKIKTHGSKVWLINTGWTGGEYGVGTRIKLAYTRRMLEAALNDELENSSFKDFGYFGFRIPTKIKDVPTNLLDPSVSWENKIKFEEKIINLKQRFDDNIKHISATEGVGKISFDI